MKTLTILATVILLVMSFAVTQAFEGAEIKTVTTDRDEEKPGCPTTKITDNALCFRCHVVKKEEDKAKWGLKEIDPNEQYVYPIFSGFYFSLDENGKRVANLLLREIDSEQIEKTFKYLAWHPEIKHINIELHNPGGSMLDMWRIVGLMDSWKTEGKTISTKCNGFAASAAFVLFVNGTPGMRLVHPNAFLMWHEVMSFKMFALTTPSSSEDEAHMLRKFQDNANKWLSERSKLTKEEVDTLVHKKELWMTGYDAVTFGFADGFVK